MEQIAEFLIDFFSSFLGKSETLEGIIDIVVDVFFDVLKILPILFLVYLLIEFLNKKFHNKTLNSKGLIKYGPIAGAAAGIIPQCGFSAAAATLYQNRAITASTLIAVFVSTSDEALPILLSHPEKFYQMIFLIGIKFLIAVVAGYVLSVTVFKNETLAAKKEKNIPADYEQTTACEDKECHDSCHHHKNIFTGSIIHSLKISLYILITLLIVQLCVFFIGEDNVSAFLLSNNIFQPILAAIFGLVPGCGTSVLITELYLSGSFSFASCVAGLCTGAGFGFLILFNFSQVDKGNKKKSFMRSLKILLIVLIIGIISGMILSLFNL